MSNISSQKLTLTELVKFMNEIKDLSTDVDFQNAFHRVAFEFEHNCKSFDNVSSINTLVECFKSYISLMSVYLLHMHTDMISEKISVSTYMILLNNLNSIDCLKNVLFHKISPIIHEILCDPDLMEVVGSELLRFYNNLVRNTEKSVREEIGQSFASYIVNLVDNLIASGCYEYQVLILENLFLVCTAEKLASLANDLFPDAESLQYALKNFDSKHFNYSARNFLNMTNKIYKRVLSVVADSVQIDGNPIYGPVDVTSFQRQPLWIDFNNNSLSVYCEQKSTAGSQQAENNMNWELITVFYDDIDDCAHFKSETADYACIFNIFLKNKPDVIYYATRKQTSCQNVSMVFSSSQAFGIINEIMLRINQFQNIQSQKISASVFDDKIYPPSFGSRAQSFKSLNEMLLSSPNSSLTKRSPSQDYRRLLTGNQVAADSTVNDDYLKNLNQSYPLNMERSAIFISQSLSAREMEVINIDDDDDSIYIENVPSDSAIIVINSESNTSSTEGIIYQSEVIIIDDDDENEDNDKECSISIGKEKNEKASRTICRIVSISSAEKETIVSIESEDIVNDQHKNKISDSQKFRNLDESPKKLLEESKTHEVIYATKDPIEFENEKIVCIDLDQDEYEGADDIYNEKIRYKEELQTREKARKEKSVFSINKFGKEKLKAIESEKDFQKESAIKSKKTQKNIFILQNEAIDVSENGTVFRRKNPIQSEDINVTYVDYQKDHDDSEVMKNKKSIIKNSKQKPPKSTSGKTYKSDQHADITHSKTAQNSSLKEISQNDLKDNEHIEYKNKIVAKESDKKVSKASKLSSDESSQSDSMKSSNSTIIRRTQQICPNVVLYISDEDEQEEVNEDFIKGVASIEPITKTDRNGEISQPSSRASTSRSKSVSVDEAIESNSITSSNTSVIGRRRRITSFHNPLNSSDKTEEEEASEDLFEATPPLEKLIIKPVYECKINLTQPLSGGSTIRNKSVSLDEAIESNSIISNNSSIIGIRRRITSFYNPLNSSDEIEQEEEASEDLIEATPPIEKLITKPVDESKINLTQPLSGASAVPFDTIPPHSEADEYASPTLPSLKRSREDEDVIKSISLIEKSVVEPITDNVSQRLSGVSTVPLDFDTLNQEIQYSKVNDHTYPQCPFSKRARQDTTTMTCDDLDTTDTLKEHFDPNYKMIKSYIKCVMKHVEVKPKKIELKTSIVQTKILHHDYVNKSKEPVKPILQLKKKGKRMLYNENYLEVSNISETNAKKLKTVVENQQGDIAKDEYDVEMAMEKLFQSQEDKNQKLDEKNNGKYVQTSDVSSSEDEPCEVITVTAQIHEDLERLKKNEVSVPEVISQRKIDEHRYKEKQNKYNGNDLERSKIDETTISESTKVTELKEKCQPDQIFTYEPRKYTRHKKNDLEISGIAYLPTESISNDKNSCKNETDILVPDQTLSPIEPKEKSINYQPKKPKEKSKTNQKEIKRAGAPISKIPNSSKRLNNLQRALISDEKIKSAFNGLDDFMRHCEKKRKSLLSNTNTNVQINMVARSSVHVNEELLTPPNISRNLHETLINEIPTKPKVQILENITIRKSTKPILTDYLTTGEDSLSLPPATRDEYIRKMKRIFIQVNNYTTAINELMLKFETLFNEFTKI